MRIIKLNDGNIAEIPFHCAGRGHQKSYIDRLPIQIAKVSGLPDELDALIATSDLQGRETQEMASGANPRLLGERIAEELFVEILPSLQFSPEKVGILLAGDFFTVANVDKRGGTGDVTRVWQAFAELFRWVVGVAGNHDLFGEAESPRLPIASNAHFLDGEVIELDGLKIAGISGIIGNPRKPNRRDEADFLASVRQLPLDDVDLLLMHTGPSGSGAIDAQPGIAAVRKLIEQDSATLVVRGHDHWDQPLSELNNDNQVLNVDCRTIILVR
jgi:Icc protein